MEEDGVELARPVYVVGIVAAAGDEAIVLLAAYRGADTVIPGHLPLPWLSGGSCRPPSLLVRAVSRSRRRRSSPAPRPSPPSRSEAHTSEVQSLMRNSYAGFCLEKKKHEHRVPERS